MNVVRVEVRRLAGADPKLPLPEYQTSGAAGLDVAANLAPGDREGGLVLAPGERALVPTGLAIGVPEGFEMQVRPRSGLALREGLTILNSPGTIDSDYRGEVCVVMVNHGQAPVTISHGMRVAQLVLARAVRVDWQEVETLDVSLRGTDGFGSTGRE